MWANAVCCVECGCCGGGKPGKAGREWDLQRDRVLSGVTGWVAERWEAWPDRDGPSEPGRGEAAREPEETRRVW